MIARRRPVLLTILLSAAVLFPVPAVFPVPAALAAPAPGAPGGGTATAGAVTWSVEPSKATGPDGRVSFRYSVRPGTRIDDHITVGNFSDREVAFKLYASDGVTTSDGVFDLLPGSQAPADSGTWVRLARSEVRVPANQRLTVPFTLTVPRDAAPGDHPAGIVAAVAGAAGAEVAVERRVGARIHLRVAGAIAPRLAVSGLTTDYTGGWRADGAGSTRVSFDVVNEGNVRLQGRATLELRGPLGVWSRTVDLGAVPEILPRFRYRMSTVVEDVPPAVVLDSSVRIVPGVVGEDRVDAPLPEAAGGGRSWAMPWLWTLLLLAAVAGATYLFTSRGRQRRRLAVEVARAREEGRREAAGTA